MVFVQGDTDTVPVESRDGQTLTVDLLWEMAVVPWLGTWYPASDRRGLEPLLHPALPVCPRASSSGSWEDVVRRQ